MKYCKDIFLTRNMLKFSLLFVIVCLINVTISLPEHNHLDAGVDRLAHVNTAMTGQYLLNYAFKYPGKTCLMSMITVLSELGQEALHSEGPKQEKLLRHLNMSSVEMLRRTFPLAIVDFKDHSTVRSSISMKIFNNKNCRVTSEYRKSFTDIFSGETGYIDLNNRTRAAREINSWVMNQSSRQIKPVIRPEEISNNIIQIYANYQEYEVDLNVLLNNAQILTKDFFISKDKAIKLPTLCGDAHMKYAKLGNLEAEAIGLPMGNGDITLLVITPEYPEGLIDVMEKMKSPDVLIDVMNKLEPCYSKVEIAVSQDYVNEPNGQQQSLLDADLTDLRNIFPNRNYVFKSTVLKKRKFVDSMKGPENVNSSCPRVSQPVHKANRNYVWYLMCPSLTPLYAGTYFGKSNTEN